MVNTESREVSRCFAKRVTFFKCTVSPPYLMHFGALITMVASKNQNSQKFAGPSHLKILTFMKICVEVSIPFNVCDRKLTPLICVLGLLPRTVRFGFTQCIAHNKIAIKTTYTGRAGPDSAGQDWTVGRAESGQTGSGAHRIFIWCRHSFVAGPLP